MFLVRYTQLPSLLEKYFRVENPATGAQNFKFNLTGAQFDN